MKVVDLLALIAVGAIALVGYDKYKSYAATRAESQAAPTPISAPASSAAEPIPATEQFKCDGRTQCSQMTSCAEATYFLQHCPNTKMDGNNDGEPCEQQWCT